MIKNLSNEKPETKKFNEEGTQTNVEVEKKKEWYFWWNINNIILQDAFVEVYEQYFRKKLNHFPRCLLFREFLKHSQCHRSRLLREEFCIDFYPKIRLHPYQKSWMSPQFNQLSFFSSVSFVRKNNYWEIRIRNSRKSIVPLRSSSISAINMSSSSLVGLWPNDLNTVFSSYITCCVLCYWLSRLRLYRREQKLL